MTETTDPHRLADAVAHLQRQLAELRDDLDYLTLDSQRQEEQHDALDRKLNELAVKVGNQLPGLSTGMLLARLRLDLAQSVITRLETEQQNLARRTDWTESWLHELDMWVQHLAARFWPKAQALHGTDLKRFFPQGFAVVPNHRLPKKPPKS
jgi:exonuclease VII large subunit